MKKQLLTLAGLCLLSTASFAQKTLIHCGTLIDGVQNEAQSQVTIVVEGKKITAIQKGFTSPSGTDKVINLKTQTVMPGLTDMHVHLENETSKGGELKRYQQNQADVAFDAAKYAKTTLMAGFTTVRDLGGSGVNIALRNAINKGTTIGPRVFTSGKTIATTGGHGDPSNALADKLSLDPQYLSGVVNGADECRQAVRQRYKEGSDCIKITATGGVLSLAKSGKAPQFTEEEIKAIVETAKDYGFHVAAHAHGAEGIKRAIRGGVTTIEHGTYMDDEAIELMKKYGTYFVPTIIAGKTVADSAKIPGYYHPLVVPKALEIGPLIQATFAKAYKAGVKIAFGTDSGVSIHGYNAYEFQYMVEAGMPAMEAIKAATMTPAIIMGTQKEAGSIETGKIADIIATDGNPLQDIKVMRKVSFVMKDGVVYKTL
ncbi:MULTISPECIES: amidohydrolase family protein [unclassified Arcicella]|uniref:metal-dependent hydrolase family protein n=1 Tax=unclassified Arcicella TaxID=2644986 RepID=UPI00285E351C|nr:MULTISPECIES: amidohydrolase family protein [unclassified Arcicella]MDR6563221.1 imidazolonepropionase-like amidohydrolase [Arcicella sp. BE51]MDR6811628.1 imidazolonepropionase-like amidohydrolase [Arcicella sp. BE140]MDR6823154.1 imidazolonepropionase-like amidohydrolase [Arcicella sp. BE139]